MRWVIVSLVLSSYAFAGPATAPTSAPFDASTPKGALKIFSRALEAGDRTAILDSLAATTDQEHKLAAATADLAAATATLKASALKAFGQAKSRPLGVDPDAGTTAAARIDASTETIDGDTAVVRMLDNEGPPMSLVKQAGKWRLPVNELTKDVEAADIDKNLADVTIQIGLMRSLAKEIDAGKYATAMEARTALDQRIRQGAAGQIGATTKAATEPVTQPAIDPNAAPVP